LDKDALARLGPALDQYLEVFAGCAVAPTRRLIGMYVRGQLSALPRKSVKPMAMEAGVPPRTLQELLSLHRWDEDLLIAMLQRRVRRSHGGSQSFGICFETRCVKKGDRTPGVERQSCEAASRARNCVVFVHLGLVDGDFRCMLDSAVYLPESWTRDQARRSASGIPPETKYRTKPQIAADLLRRAAVNGLSLDRLILPSEYAVDQAASQAFRNQGHPLAIFSSFNDPDSGTSGVSEEVRRQLLRPGVEARRGLEARMDEIGLDHFEVRTFRSLTRHLALSAVSMLFLAEQAERTRRPSGSVPLRTHA
jgi:SRSO17 transposase